MAISFRSTQRLRTAAAVLVMALLVLVGVGGASRAEELRFDFEKGLGGWIFGFGFIFLQETDILGGQHAVYGVDNADMFMSLDLSGVSSIAIKQYWQDPDPRFLETRSLATVILNPVGGGILDRRRLGRGESVWATPEDPHPNPDLRRWDISDWPHTDTNITLRWDDVLCAPEFPEVCIKDFFAGWIDDVVITFVPEPGAFGSGMVSLGVLVFCRARKCRSPSARVPGGGGAGLGRVA